MGWKKTENVSANISFGDPCRCEHMLGKFCMFALRTECLIFLWMLSESHISHLRTKSEQELDPLLSMVVDSDNMYIAMTREENAETKKLYSYLFRVCNDDYG